MLDALHTVPEREASDPAMVHIRFTDDTARRPGPESMLPLCHGQYGSGMIATRCFPFVHRRLHPQSADLRSIAPVVCTFMSLTPGTLTWMYQYSMKSRKGEEHKKITGKGRI